MTMRAWLKERIKKAFENTESTITSVIVLALFGGSAAILAVYKKALGFFLQILTTPTPLWATILLIPLCYLYIYLKLRKTPLSSIPLQQLLPQDDLNTLTLKFGIYWDKNKQPHCPTCKTPLSRYKEEQSASGNFSAYFLCPKCRLPIYLQNDEAPITLQQAKKQL
jgi:hypothetical protein